VALLLGVLRRLQAAESVSCCLRCDSAGLLQLLLDRKPCAGSAAGPPYVQHENHACKHMQRQHKREGNSAKNID
jgi:hypothetical protein